MKFKSHLFLFYLILSGCAAYCHSWRPGSSFYFHQLSAKTDTPACPVIDEDSVQYSCANGSKSDGYIRGLRAVYKGKLTYSWKKNGIEVGNSLNLVNIRPGKYRLTVNGGNCGPVYSGEFVIGQNNLEPDFSKMKITPSSCTNKAGSITGIQVPPGTYVYWSGNAGGAAARSIDLTNVPPGSYRLGCSNDTTCTVSFGPFIIPRTDGPNIDTTHVIITPSNCSQANGSITGLRIINPAGATNYLWVDDAGKTVGNTPDIKNLPPGQYLFIASNADGGCESTYGKVAVAGIGFPVIDYSQLLIRNPDCRRLSGSITGLTATGKGKVTYQWLNSSNKVVTENADLNSVLKGMYTLKVTDESGCGATYSPAYSLRPETGMTMYAGPAIQATCNSYGSAFLYPGTSNYPTDYIYRWLDDETGKVVDTLSGFTNVPGGQYTVFVTSQCDPGMFTFNFDLGPKWITLANYAYAVNNTCPGQNAGSIKIDINGDQNVKGLRWVDDSGQNKGASSEIDNLPQGNYQLFITDAFGCERLYGTYTVITIPALNIVSNTAKVVDDKCNTGAGSITGVRIDGGQPPLIYNWTDGTGKTITTQADLVNATAGDYTLMVTDAGSCGVANATFTVQNNDSMLNAPNVSSLQLCNDGAAVLQVTDTVQGSKYRLYDSPSATQPIDEEAGGRFTVTSGNSAVYYVSQVLGDCESSRAAVSVKYNISKNSIPNTISPNADGVNDVWDIKGLENYPGAVIQLFNRNGQVVFQSNGYPKPFDGTLNGKKLPAGVYYYVINLHSKCSILSGSLTIVR